MTSHAREESILSSVTTPPARLAQSRIGFQPVSRSTGRTTRQSALFRPLKVKTRDRSNATAALSVKRGTGQMRPHWLSGPPAAPVPVFPSRADRADGSAMNRFCGALPLGHERNGVRRVCSEFCGCSLGMRATNHAPGAQKKSANLHQAAENPVETFVRQIALPHIDLWAKAPYRLQRQVAGFGFPNHS